MVPRLQPGATAACQLNTGPAGLQQYQLEICISWRRVAGSAVLVWHQQIAQWMMAQIPLAAVTAAHTGQLPASRLQAGCNDAAGWAAEVGSATRDQRQALQHCHRQVSEAMGLFLQYGWHLQAHLLLMSALLINNVEHAAWSLGLRQVILRAVRSSLIQRSSQFKLAALFAADAQTGKRLQPTQQLSEIMLARGIVEAA